MRADTSPSLAPTNGSSAGSVGVDAPRAKEVVERLPDPCTRTAEKDVAESERASRSIGAVPKQCWFNARRAVMKLDGYSRASYVEGYAVLPGGILVEHGWVVRDGAVIDPSLPTEPARYFPGLEFRGRAGIEEFLATPGGRRCRRSPFFYTFGWGGRSSPGFAEAFREAVEYAGTRGHGMLAPNDDDRT